MPSPPKSTSKGKAKAKVKPMFVRVSHRTDPKTGQKRARPTSSSGAAGDGESQKKQRTSAKQDGGPSSSATSSQAGGSSKRRKENDGNNADNEEEESNDVEETPAKQKRVRNPWGISKEDVPPAAEKTKVAFQRVIRALGGLLTQRDVFPSATEARKHYEQRFKTAVTTGHFCALYLAILGQVRP
ncbi:hypothetical protein R3P38DRAFT_3596374 [Favolaschia claudopus]|uniref:Uncharacterized protein n=1 Tax=Favolaschia claudopus TaxID=2862362 RepID=A0AAW0AGH6_9AGAR